MWMAEGCLRSSQTMELESIGAEYFDELVMRSFFQDLEIDVDGNVSYCKMHDLIHDFATFLGNNECLVVESNEINFTPSKTRHLSVMFSNKFHRIPHFIRNWESLQTLPEDLTLLSHLTSLRTLDLSNNALIKELPKEVEKLIHLRYLNLSSTGVEELPETVTNLSNLQMLKLQSCSKLRRLPNMIGKLVSLRHLEAVSSELEELPETISNFSNLQTLKLNKCWKLRKLPNGIGKLVSLRHLEAEGTKLEELPETIINLSNLQTLRLNWCKVLCRLPDEMGKMLSLRQLEAEYTKLEEVPETVGNLSNLQTLKLNFCEKLRRLPNEMGKMVSLSHLEFESVSSLECFPRVIGKLRELETLSKFIVSEEGSNIGELKDLNNLRSYLVISNIKGGGKEAILKDKEYLWHLTLRFNDEAAKSVLELLEPHPNLEKEDQV
ncbi:hypothetical protein GIB67_005921 [Kingdonia uniflora]|uniref:Uncharacterized protein n=2 Tax=Kingdonia uniflora TaxID=39325 RepID=A0A7J7MBK7_9MAGN|nr:hypothetical protein GIB67_005921 [Kingdonia uniflora]